MAQVGLKAQTMERFLARRNRSKSWLALKLGISSGYLSQLMAGDRHPSPRMREKFLEVLPEFEFDDLFEICSPHGDHHLSCGKGATDG